MKTIYKLIIIFTGIILFSSCNKDEGVKVSDIGQLELRVNSTSLPEVETIITRSEGLDVNDFSITIDDGAGYNEYWETYSALKQEGVIELKSGTYTAEARSFEGEYGIAEEEPIYSGTTTFTIVADNPTIVEIKCTMEQIAIELDLSALKNKVSNLGATIRIDKTGGDLCHYLTNGNIIKDVWYFIPNEDYYLVLTGTYQGYELGELGYIRLLDIPGVNEIKRHTHLKIRVDGQEPTDALRWMQTNLFPIKINATIES